MYISQFLKDLPDIPSNILIYADGIVVFTYNRYLDEVIRVQNIVLSSISTILNNLFFSLASNKSKTMIFTRRRVEEIPNTYQRAKLHRSYSSSHQIFWPNFRLKIRWLPHIKYFSEFTYKWSNVLRSLTGTDWGCHLSWFLLIYTVIIRTKLEYRSFLYGSAATSLNNKLSTLQNSCLRSVLGALNFTPVKVLEMEILSSVKNKK